MKLDPIQLLEALPGHVTIKDLDCNYTHLSQKTANLFGYRNLDEFLDAGASWHCIRNGAAEHGDEIIRQDKIVMHTEEPLKVLGSYSFEQREVHFGEKRPLYDENKAMIGIICHSQDVTNCHMINSYFLVAGQDQRFNGRQNISYYITKAYKPLNLTSRQTECLYYIIRGYSASNVAELLNLSKRTIEFHMNEIKHVMSCQNRAEVIDKAIHSGFLNIIPQSLLTV